jgi:NAD(P)-dependent dehydrogenase (short-subunit alcohol dehydrogenase family)
MNKVALITGTSTGLGLHLAIILAKQGYKTYATMRNTDKKTELLGLAKQAGVEVIVKQLDVQDTVSIEHCVAEIMAESGAIDVLVNNAGAGFVRTTEQATEEEIQWVLDVNLMGVIRCTKAVIAHMRERRSGHIVNIGSVGGLVGQPFNEIYCAAKFAVEGYTESMATYIQPKFGVNFTVVEPGGISSDFAKNVFGQFESTGGMIDDEYKPILESYLGGARARAAAGDTSAYQTSEEVAQVVADCIGSAAPPVRLRTSTWAENFCQLKTGADPDGTAMREAVFNTFLQ